MSAHVHKLNREKFIAEMARRGWKLDEVGWIVPEGRRIHQRESDWLASILLSIECECPLPSTVPPVAHFKEVAHELKLKANASDLHEEVILAELLDAFRLAPLKNQQDSARPVDKQQEKSVETAK